MKKHLFYLSAILCLLPVIAFADAAQRASNKVLTKVCLQTKIKAPCCLYVDCKITRKNPFDTVKNNVLKCQDNTIPLVNKMETFSSEIERIAKERNRLITLFNQTKAEFKQADNYFSQAWGIKDGIEFKDEEIRNLRAEMEKCGEPWKKEQLNTEKICTQERNKAMDSCVAKYSNRADGFEKCANDPNTLVSTEVCMGAWNKQNLVWKDYRVCEEPFERRLRDISGRAWEQYKILDNRLDDISDAFDQTYRIIPGLVGDWKNGILINRYTLNMFDWVEKIYVYEPTEFVSAEQYLKTEILVPKAAVMFDIYNVESMAGATKKNCDPIKGDSYNDTLPFWKESIAGWQKELDKIK